MAIQKKVNGAWQPINPKQLKGIPYTGILPATLTGTKAGYLHRYKIYGNTEQAGTPTPENPIMPSGCGERTGNLFPQDFLIGKSTIVQKTFNELASSIIFTNGQYTFSANTSSETGVGIFKVCFTYTDGSQDKSEWISKRTSVVVLVSNGTKVVKSISITNYNYYSDVTLSNIMLNSGSTALPYEPYGYRLPMLSNSTLTNIYLGEAETTRRIKKLVLTGEEKWAQTTDENFSTSLPKEATPWKGIFCTHFEASQITYNISRLILKTSRTSFETLSGFKSYLATQYAAGTPVTVWYVLAEPETAVVNEPLMKIGDYADTIDSTQSTTRIPTSANSTTISWAGEGLAPSEVDSIQEWVDIPTYTYTNGAWVADN